MSRELIDLGHALGIMRNGTVHYFPCFISNSSTDAQGKLWFKINGDTRFIEGNFSLTIPTNPGLVWLSPGGGYRDAPISGSTLSSLFVKMQYTLNSGTFRLSQLTTTKAYNSFTLKVKLNNKTGTELFSRTFSNGTNQTNTTFLINSDIYTGSSNYTIYVEVVTPLREIWYDPISVSTTSSVTRSVNSPYVIGL